MPEINEYEIEMTLISETVLGSGHGGGSGINLDVLRDKDGKHFVKSTTFKGLVREQLEWIASSCSDVDKEVIDSLLGKSDVQAGKLHFWDLKSSAGMPKERKLSDTPQQWMKTG